jgi:hypothetical protein
MVTYSEKPATGAWGFRLITCPICQKVFRYPLDSGYVGLYWLAIIGGVGLGIYVLQTSPTVRVNPLGIIVLTFAIIGLVRNSNLKQEIAEMKKGLPKDPNA